MIKAVLARDCFDHVAEAFLPSVMWGEFGNIIQNTSNEVTLNFLPSELFYTRFEKMTGHSLGF